MAFRLRLPKWYAPFENGTVKVLPVHTVPGTVGSHTEGANHWIAPSARRVFRYCTGPVRSGRMLATPVRVEMFTFEPLARMLTGLPVWLWMMLANSHPLTTRLPLKGRS